MKKVLLLDTNLSSFPIYDELISHGYLVYCVGKNKNDFLAKINNSYYCCADYSDIQEIKTLLEIEKFDFIVPGCNDVSYQSAVKLCDKNISIGLDNIKNTEKINNKKNFREISNKLGLSIPIVYSENFCEKNFPLIVKPVDSYSGKGVTVILEANITIFEEAIKFAKSNSISLDCVVEQYVSGQLYSHTAFIKNKKIVKDFFVEEYGIANEFTVDTSRVVWDFNELQSKKIRKEIEILSSNLMLVDGLIHTQFILADENFWIIEITRRCPGDLYSQLIKLSSNFNYAGSYVNNFMGIDQLISHKEIRRHILRVTLTPSFRGVFRDITFIHPIHIVKLFMLKNSGENVEIGPEGKIAIVFLEASSEAELNEIIILAKNRNLYFTS